jgi:hypothetical protein
MLIRLKCIGLFGKNLSSQLTYFYTGSVGCITIDKEGYPELRLSYRG